MALASSSILEEPTDGTLEASPSDIHVDQVNVTSCQDQEASPDKSELDS